MTTHYPDALDLSPPTHAWATLAGGRLSWHRSLDAVVQARRRRDPSAPVWTRQPEGGWREVTDAPARAYGARSGAHSTRTGRIDVQLDSGTLGALDELAAARGESRSDLVRQAIESLLVTHSAARTNSTPE